MVQPSTTTPGGFVQVRPSQVASHLEDYLVLDVREPHEFHGGHLHGAENIPLGELQLAADQLDRQRPVLVVCRSGGRSARAANFLAALGFQQVHNLEGGMIAWNEARLPTGA